MSLEQTPGKDGLAAVTDDPDLNAEIEAVRLFSWPQVHAIIPIDRSTAWRHEKAGKFPKRVQISPGRVGWPADQIIALARKLREQPVAAAIALLLALPAILHSADFIA